MIDSFCLFSSEELEWPLNLNISDDFKVHSKGAFNNYVDNMRGKGSKMSPFAHAQGKKNCQGNQKMAKVFPHSR